MREWKGLPSYGGVVIVISVVVNVGVSVVFFTSVAFDDVVVVVVVSVNVQVCVAFVSSVAFDNGTWRPGNYRIIVVNIIVIVFVVVFLVIFVSVVISVVAAFIVGETVASADTL